MIQERCVHCSELITGSTRSIFETNYNDHVHTEHDAPRVAGGRS